MTTTWADSRSRHLLYRALVKTRVEIERRVGPSLAAKRALARANPRNLAWLAAVYGSDKGATAHRYVDLYAAYLTPMRRRARAVLEIGVYRGASLRMWRDYFPHADIVGLDIEPVVVDDGDRISIVVGEQADPAMLTQLRGRGPYDLVVDDGSHRGDDIVATFHGLFEAVRPGGYYVIEDMQTAYLAEYGGGPPGTAGTSVALVEAMVDAVNRRHVEAADPVVAARLPVVSELHVHPKIAFIRRAPSEGGAGAAPR